MFIDLILYDQQAITTTPLAIVQKNSSILKLEQPWKEYRNQTTKFKKKKEFTETFIDFMYSWSRFSSSQPANYWSLMRIKQELVIC